MDEPHPTSIPLTLGLIIITFGIYGVFWYILLNRTLEIYDEDAPDLTRGIAVLFLLPSISLLIISFLTLWFSESLIFKIISNSILLFLFVITIKYGHDLLVSFSKVTSKNIFGELVLFILGYLGFYASFATFYVLTPLTLLLLFPIVLLQTKLNLFLKLRQIKHQRRSYYS
jgi:hypothetical protein